MHDSHIFYWAFALFHLFSSTISSLYLSFLLSLRLHISSWVQTGLHLVFLGGQYVSLVTKYLTFLDSNSMTWAYTRQPMYRWLFCTSRVTEYHALTLSYWLHGDVDKTPIQQASVLLSRGCKIIHDAITC